MYQLGIAQAQGSSHIRLGFEELYIAGKCGAGQKRGVGSLRIRAQPTIVQFKSCLDLVDVCGLDRLLGLLSLKLVGNRKLWKLSNLSGLKRLHTLECIDLDIDEVPG